MSTAMATEVSKRAADRARRAAEFEEIYRSNVGSVAAYFARCCSEPQEVADLTSETILRAAGSFGAFDPCRGSARAWLFGIAAHVWAGGMALEFATCAARRAIDPFDATAVGVKALAPASALLPGSRGYARGRLSGGRVAPRLSTMTR
jgi:hypothetical protein